MTEFARISRSHQTSDPAPVRRFSSYSRSYNPTNDVPQRKVVLSAGKEGKNKETLIPVGEPTKTIDERTKERIQALNKLGYKTIWLLDRLYVRKPSTSSRKQTRGTGGSYVDDIIRARPRIESPNGWKRGELNEAFALEIEKFILDGTVTPAVGLFLMSIAATESGGGQWHPEASSEGYHGAFQISTESLNYYADRLYGRGISIPEFLATPEIQVRIAARLYDEKLGLVESVIAPTGPDDPEGLDFDLPEESGREGKLSEFLAYKPELYRAAYAWLTLGGVDGNGVLSEDYAGAAVANALRILERLLPALGNSGYEYAAQELQKLWQVLVEFWRGLFSGGNI